MNQHPFKNGFGSDNHSGVHPQILKAIGEVNYSHCPSYGTDSVSQQLDEKLKSLFGPNAEGFMVFNGTGANTLCLKALLQSWNSALVADISHLNMDECGAPEAIAGIKLIPVDTDKNGKLTVQALEKHLIRLGDQHFSQPGCISITQPSELGTVYSIDEMKQLAEFAKRHRLKLHMDGARLVNALHFLNITFRELLKAFPMDALSFGGTKNGLLGGELVLLWEDSLKKNFRYLRKQSLQLPSKTRFIAAQFLSWLDKNLYLEIAEHSHQMAKKLEAALQSFKEVEILYPVESNAVFIQFPKSWTQTLRSSSFFYIWDPETWSARLMTSFDTSDSDIENFCQTVSQLSQTQKENTL